MDTRISVERYNEKLQEADRFPKYQATLKNLYGILEKHDIDVTRFREIVKSSVFDCEYDQRGHLVFVGPSNCGKSSIIDAIAGHECQGFKGGILEGTEPGGMKSVHSLAPLLKADVCVLPEFKCFIKRGVMSYGKLIDMLDGTAYTGCKKRTKIPSIPYLFACRSTAETGNDENWTTRTHTFNMYGGSFDGVKKRRDLKPDKHDMAFLLLHTELDNTWSTMDTNPDNAVDGWFTMQHMDNDKIKKKQKLTNKVSLVFTLSHWHCSGDGNCLRQCQMSPDRYTNQGCVHQCQPKKCANYQYCGEEMPSESWDVCPTCRWNGLEVENFGHETEQCKICSCTKMQMLFPSCHKHWCCVKCVRCCIEPFTVAVEQILPPRCPVCSKAYMPTRVMVG